MCTCGMDMCMHVCMHGAHMFVEMCTCGSECIWKSKVDFGNCLFTCYLFMQWDKAILFWGYRVSILWGLHQHLHGFWESELWSSYLHSKLLSTEPYPIFFHGSPCFTLYKNYLEPISHHNSKTQTKKKILQHCTLAIIGSLMLTFFFLLLNPTESEPDPIGY